MSAPTATNNNNGQREAIVGKLNDALNNFRKDRDDWRRKRDLAEQQLHVKSLDREALENTIRGDQEKLARLNQSVENKEELVLLEKQVADLNKEFQFQHNELVAKKQKIALLEEKVEEESKSREAELISARDAVMKRRNKIARPNKPDHAHAKQISIVRSELQDIDSARIWPKWPRMIEQKATFMTMQTAENFRSFESLRNVIGGYNKHLASVGVVDENTAPVNMMEQ